MSREKRKSLNFILFQFLAGYLLFIFFSIFKTKFEIVPLLIRFYLNIVLVWWFTIYCVKTIVPLPSPISSELIIIIQEKFDLSKREQEVLHLILQGKNNKEIEDSLFISSSTVRNHVSAIYKKIGVKHRGQLIDLILKLQEQN
ncbi:MAG: helix-turn-helix transcriptional regulator [Bacteroidetes bacterium]|nr:helix-turn-helix transcriptional regulator [Bacteroidota bacterium]